MKKYLLLPIIAVICIFSVSCNIESVKEKTKSVFGETDSVSENDKNDEKSTADTHDKTTETKNSDSDELMAIYISYKPNIFIDGDEIRIYIDDNEIFSMMPDEVIIVLMDSDNQKHELRMESNILNLGTKKQTFSMDKMPYGDSGIYFTGYEITYHSLYAQYSLEEFTDVNEYYKYAANPLSTYFYKDGEVFSFLDKPELFGKLYDYDSDEIEDTDSDDIYNETNDETNEDYVDSEYYEDYYQEDDNYYDMYE